jgi:hypothetical protein
MAECQAWRPMGCSRLAPRFPGNAPAPPLPTDHAADSVYGADAMAMGRITFSSITAAKLQPGAIEPRRVSSSATVATAIAGMARRGSG